MKKDMIIGIIGGVVLIGAMVGIIVYESASFVDTENGVSSGSKTYSVSFAEKSEVFTLSGELDDGDSQIGTTSAYFDNITRVVFKLTWTDDETTLSGADAFTLDIVPPTGTAASFAPSQSISSDSGEITLTSTVNGIPNDEKVIRANSAADAVKTFGGEYATGNGNGDWSSGISLSTGSPLSQLDSGNSYSLEVTVFYYEPVAEEVEEGYEDPSLL